MSGESLQVSRAELSELIGDALDARLDARRTIDEDTHRLDHDWIAEERSRRRARAVSIAKVRESVIGWIVIALLSGIGTLVYSAAKLVMREGGGE